MMLKKIKITNSDHPKFLPNGTIMIIIKECPDGVEAVPVNDLWFIYRDTFERLDELNPSSAPSPRPWKDLTPEEKGDLLLAHHEGKRIEGRFTCESLWFEVDPVWADDTIYRIRPEMSTVAMPTPDGNYKIEYVTENGIPDPSSIQMIPI